MAETIDGLYLGKSSNERGQKTSLGRQLRKHRDQVVDSFRLEEAGILGGTAHWRLRVVTAAQPGSNEIAEVIDLR